MLIDDADPIRPSLELTALLCGPGSHEITALQGLAGGWATVRRDGQSVDVPDGQNRTVRLLTAMLAAHPNGWTINGTPARIIKPPLPDLCVTIRIQQDGHWRTAVINGQPELLHNCLIDGLRSSLPGLEHTALTYECALPSPTEDEARTGWVTLQPVARLSAGELGLENGRTPDAARIESVARRRARQMDQEARRWIREATAHPLLPAPA